MTFHYKKQFIIHVVVGLVIFLIGRTNSPVIPFDPEFLMVQKIESKLNALKIEIFQMGISHKKVFALEEKFKSVEADIESTLVHSRKRFYSTTITDLTAVFVVLIGGLISVIRSWKRDVLLLR